MKNGAKLFGAIWAIIFVIFNVLVLVSYSQLDIPNVGTFFVSYVFVLITFLAILFCGIAACKKNKDGAFLKIPVLYVCYSGVILMFIVSAAVFLTGIPDWIAALICMVVLAVVAIAVMTMDSATNHIAAIDQQIKRDTFFMKALTVDADRVLSKAKSNEVQKECRRAYEAIRYSDPMANPYLEPIETKIYEQLTLVEKAVEEDDAQLTKANVDELIILVNSRNQKCKLLK